MKHTVAIVTALLVFLAPACAAPIVFFDDFEDEVANTVPALDTINDIGTSWGIPNGTLAEFAVRANPNAAAGNASAQALFSDPPAGTSPRSADGRLLNSIFIEGATISFDFYIPGLGNVGNSINVRLMSTNKLGALSGLGGLNLRVDGGVGGSGGVFNDGINPGTLNLDHFGSNVWQNAKYTYSNLDSVNGFLDTTLTITRMTDNAFVTGTARWSINTTNWTGFEEFAVVNPQFDGTAAYEAYIDNLKVEGLKWAAIPEPTALALAGLGLIGLLAFRRCS
jgi:hypothetical protein